MPCRLGRLPQRFALSILAILAAAGAVGRAAEQSGHGTRAVRPDGEAVYQAACAACHGPDGRGRPRSVVGFDVPLPDLSDCSFATREPDADWLAIAHGGGPVRAFDRMMPAFGDALRAEELAGALAHIRSWCEGAPHPRGELNLPRPLFVEKAYPEDEAVFELSVDGDGGAYDSTLIYERRFGARNQWEIVLPVPVRQDEEGRWHGGPGDIGLAVRRAVHHDLDAGRILSAAAELVLPTGREADGLGGGTVLVEPYVSFGQILPSDWFLHAQGGAEIPFDRDKGEVEGFWRGAVGRSFTQGLYGRTWSPMVELLGARAFESGAAVEWDIVPQVQVTLSTRQHIMFNLGVRLPLNERDGRSTRVATYLLWDWFDGGFFEGW